MAQLNSCVVFPQKQYFFNNIQQRNIEENDYENAQKLFNSKIESGEWRSMADFLQYYNLLDVVPLVHALQNCFKNYAKYFEIDSMNFLSLPSIGFSSMYNLYNENLAFVFSFNNVGDEIRQMFRENVLGGLSSVFHRFERVNVYFTQ